MKNIYLMLSINSIIYTREIRTVEMRYVKISSYDDFSCREIVLDNRPVKRMFNASRERYVRWVSKYILSFVTVLHFIIVIRKDEGKWLAFYLIVWDKDMYVYKIRVIITGYWTFDAAISEYASGIKI